MDPSSKVKPGASQVGPTALLHEREASIRAVVEGEMNRFSECLSALERLARALESPFAVVGGLAAIHHNAMVTTLDVDIAVAADRLEAILREAPRHGFEVRRHSPRGWHRMAFPHPDGDVEVHVIPEGARSPRDPEHAPLNPGPRDLGVLEGIGYAAFAPWVVTKLVAAREKDRYHLVEALRHASGEQIAAVVVLLRGLHSSYLEELERLLRRAEEERDAKDW
jgi:hypothetical protein